MRLLQKSSKRFSGQIEMRVDNSPSCGNIGGMLKRYPILIFAIYLFFYVISPLSYTYERKQVFSQRDASSGSFRLLIIELLLSRLTHEERQDDDTPNYLIFKKKRATLSSDKLKISKDLTKNIYTVSEWTIPSEMPCRVIVSQDNGPEYKRYSHLLHSGLSPPFV